MAKSTRPRFEGHAQDTQASHEIGLPGKFHRPIKITMLGAGSSFTQSLMNDIFRTPGNMGGTIALVDIDPKRLSVMRRFITYVLAQSKSPNWKIIASTNRRDVMKDTDYLVNCVEVSGVDCVLMDNQIPLKYGVDQCIGDTAGPGGLFKALRTVPIWLEILKDAERLCPQAIVLNYTNPMAMMCLAAGRTSSLPVVGLCHSVQGTSNRLAKRAHIPYEELEYECAGINHLSWFVKLAHKGKSLYPRLCKMAREDLAGRQVDPDDIKDWVRKDVMLHFGAFVTETSGHLSEYLPYYRKRKDLFEKYCQDKNSGTNYYANNWPTWRGRADKERLDVIRDKTKLNWARSWEYATWIMEAREKDTPYRIHGNVMNRIEGGGGRLITNLPEDGCVEVACMVDGNGIQPTRFGALPPQMAALSASNMHMFDLGATAAITRSKEAAIHALLLDPLTAAVCSPAEIKKMGLEMFRAQKKFLPGYR